DAGIMSSRTDPDLFAAKDARPLPDPQMVASSKGVIQFFEYQIGRPAVQKKHRDRRLLITTHLRHGLKGSELGFGPEPCRGRPAGFLKSFFELCLGAEEQDVRQVGR